MNSEPVRLERRSGQRFQMHLPLAIKMEGRTLHGFTQDVSARGLFLYCDTPLTEGTAVELTFIMPSEITLAENMRVRCRARVLRANRCLSGPRNGVAVQLDSHEYLPSVDFEISREVTPVSAAEALPENPEIVPR